MNSNKFGYRIVEKVNYKGVVISYVVERLVESQQDDYWQDFSEASTIEEAEKIVEDKLQFITYNRVVKEY